MAGPLLPIVLLGAGIAFLLSQHPPAAPQGSIAATIPLDSNLDQRTADAVRSALAFENDPSRLEAFAATLTPEHPIAAGALRTKAAGLRAGVAPDLSQPVGIPTNTQLPLPSIPGVPPPPPPPSPGAPPPIPQQFLSSTGFFAHATVTTQTDPLNLRSGPSISAPVIGSLPRGATVDVTPPVPQAAAAAIVPSMFLPVSFQGKSGFASAQFLHLIP